MPDSGRLNTSTPAQVLPPPPPPLPPSRAISNRPGVLQRLVALTQRVPIGQGHQSSGARTQDVPTRLHSYTPLLVQTVAHKTGIPIAAVDISPNKTHAILAGKEILKTVRVADRKITEDVNLRSAVISYASAHGSHNGTAIASQRRDFLSATDVKWSHAEYDHIIAAAANNGRLSIYDVKRPEQEYLWLHEHTRQIHTLGFNPFQGALLLSGSHDGTVKYWDLRMSSREKSSHTLKSTKQFSGRAEAVRHLRWSPMDGVEFITCTDGGTIFKWDSRKMDRPELRINGHEKACYSVDWHPDGRHVVSGSADKNVKVWDFKNPDRRQKPCFQFRAPQVVMNIRWRPASWSSALHRKGDWQSTQLAVGYNADDPRVHIWDLRRPLIPFRELDRYNSPATSLLWCTKDLLWTVGNEGMFTQTDVHYSPQPPEQISPCTMNWLPTGEYVVFTENQGRRRSIESDDPTVGFRKTGRDDFSSSGEQVMTSRSMTDDEGVHEHLLGPTYKRSQANRGSVQAVRSLGNTPPSRDDPNTIMPLDKTIYDKNNMIHNGQIGVVGKTTGAAIDLPTFQYLAENYARPAMEAERKQKPAEILKRLEEAFKTNGNVCDQVSMHRLAQTWRILGAIIVPELQAWADQNRRERLSQTFKSSSRDDKTDGLIPGIQLPPGSRNGAERFERLLGTTQAVKGDLFKDIVRSEREKLNHEAESTSNMATPLARPMPDSILPAPSKSPRALSLNDESDAIPHLPLSVIAAHSTAAAASRVLRSDVDKSLGTVSTDDALSPDRPGDMADATMKLPEGHISTQGIGPQTIKRSKSDWFSAGEFRSGDQHRREHNKRAALLEYKAQPKTILHFDTPYEETAQKGLAITGNRHNSAESLEMFSESTSGSHRAKSLVSSESAGASYQNKASIASEDWAYHHPNSLEPHSSPEDAQRLHPRMQEPIEQQRSTSRNSDRSSSSFPDAPFDFERPPTKHQPHGWLRSVSRSPQPLIDHQRLTDREPSPLPTADELQSPHYVYTDFQPLDLQDYYINQAKPWSALPLVSQIIAFDLDLGENHAQFSTHLLMHIHPFFFHRKYRKKQPPPGALALPQAVADRLLHPHLSYRIIESIFQQHHTFLKSLSLHLCAAELRNLCVEFDISSVYRRRITPDEGPESSLNDGYSLQITCTNPNCSAPLSFDSTSSYMEPTSCTRCNTPRPPCPICLSLQHPSQQRETQPTSRHPETAGTDKAGPAHLWTFCQSCGHSAHMSCMETWLHRATSQGECPSGGCGHDCAPGEVRRRRVADLAAAAVAPAVVVQGEKQTAGEAKGRNDDGGEKRNGGSWLKDTWKASPSAAVERTRGLLWSSVASTAMGTGNGSGSEREVGRGAAAAAAPAAGVGIGGGAGAGGSSPIGRKVVRLMTPGEEMPRAVDEPILS
ncbi:hypothetical protein GJ744_005841 [Endocarpon pusillum]|uniref:Restriction of telomere capping protein 1 n=1 Tax=Endocarpon pusillum TaxID=364733 RepID=A0A8H7DWY1_9EURO|nr:hypothetical protein GJ744_005841 [Endocarpon pusillum]